MFLIAGGPGAGITREFAKVAGAFARLNVKRDLVLIDQRGTGLSHALDCMPPTTLLDEDAQGLAARMQACRDKLDADPRFYATPDAIVDLDTVRDALGYERINLYGSSYGTRVALAYARAHPNRLRSMILDGVVAFGTPLGPSMAIDAQRALDGVFARCAADASCHAAFSELPQDLQTLLARLESPVEVPMLHPTTGEPTTLRLTRRVAAGTIRMLSYASDTASLLPLLIHAGATGNLGPLAAQSVLIERLLSLSEGMHFSVICSEDYPAFGELTDRGTYLEGLIGGDYAAVCAIWPRARLPAHFDEPVRSDVPTLLLSGKLDPVTPPANAERARTTLPRSRHLVLPGEAHGILYRGCVLQLVSEFLDALHPEALDTSCLEQHRPLPFFSSFKGPQP